MATLPLIVAGPIVRRLENRACSFWIALRDSALVTANVWPGERAVGATLDDTSGPIDFCTV